MFSNPPAMMLPLPDLVDLAQLFFWLLWFYCLGVLMMLLITDERPTRWR